jgi:chemotaxis protein methyltransferase CheR
VKFVPHNLAADAYPPPGCGFAAADLIICRNVLIYFDRLTVAHVADRLLAALSPDGWLLLGASDPPIAELVPCEVVVTDAGLVYRRTTIRERDSRVTDLQARATTTAVQLSANVTGERYAPSGPPLEAPGAGDVPVASATEPALPELLLTRYAERDYRSAVAVAERMLRTDPGSELLWITLVRSLANLGDLQQAGRANALAVERCPLSPELTYLTALLQAEGGHHLEAVAAARRALYLDHTLAVAHIALGAALAQVGQRDNAMRSFDNAERLLAEMTPERAVPAGDGETAGALIALVCTQRRLLTRPDDEHQPA